MMRARATGIRPSIRKIHWRCVLAKTAFVSHKTTDPSAYLPTCESGATIEFLDSVGEETTKSASERGSYVEDSHTTLELETAVPQREQEGRGGEETRLETKKSVCLGGKAW